jgi:hypothetical protein
MYFIPKYKRGIFNRYHKQMPVFERFTKDMSHLFISIKNWIKNGFTNKTLLVHPHYPSRGSTIYKVAKELGLNVSNKPSSSVVLAVYWEYLTFREEYHLLENQRKWKVVNLHSRDISKKYVDEVFESIFGYCTTIDPLTYTGKIVRKNDINATHDGVVLQGPLNESDPAFIYQILIDNTEEDVLVDIRVPVVGGLIDFVYLKHRPAVEQFYGKAVKSRIKSPEELLSKKEIELLNTFCKKLQLDYGELDVLRDNQSGKIYVVDVNNTSQGPPPSMLPGEDTRAIQKMANQFKRAFLN